MAEKSDLQHCGTQRKDQVVKRFVKSANDEGRGGSASRGLTIDELGREQQRRSVAYSRARGVL